MHDGIVEQIGAPLELYDRPDNLFVAGFIGSPAMNFIKGKLDANDPAKFMTAGGVALPVSKAPDDAKGKDLIYGVRPEHFHLASSGGLAARVVVVEPTGSETQVVIDIGGQELVAVFRDRISAKPGETLYLTIEAEKTHLFDAASERRL
jgi:multiple sugar transport system ATP-binding protein